MKRKEINLNRKTCNFPLLYLMFNVFLLVYISKAGVWLQTTQCAVFISDIQFRSCLSHEGQSSACLLFRPLK